MKHIHLIIVLLCINTSLCAIEARDVKYVWAVNGLNLRSAPAINSRIIKTLFYGDSVLVYELTEIEYSLIALDSLYPNVQPIYIADKWVKVKSADKEGYVFNAYLLGIPCAQPGESLNEYAIRMSVKFGHSQLNDSFQVHHSGNPGLLHFNASVINFPNSYQLSFYIPTIDLSINNEAQGDEDEGFSESSYFKGFSRQEILVLLRSFYLGQPERPYKVYNRGPNDLRLTDNISQTIDLFFYEKDVSILLFFDAGC